MRSRWQEWVIALALVALFVGGVWAIWGADLARLVHPERAEATERTAEPSRAPAPAPGGPAQGPF